jgi:hypothetical protein
MRTILSTKKEIIIHIRQKRDDKDSILLNRKSGDGGFWPPMPFDLLGNCQDHVRVVSMSWLIKPTKSGYKQRC